MLLLRLLLRRRRPRRCGCLGRNSAALVLPRRWVWAPRGGASGAELGVLHAARTAAIDVNGDLCSADSPGAVLRVYAARRGEMDGIALATTVHRLAKKCAAASERDGHGAEGVDSTVVDALLDDVVATARRQPSTLGPREVANVCWAVAKLGSLDGSWRHHRGGRHDGDSDGDGDNDDDDDDDNDKTREAASRDKARSVLADLAEVARARVGAFGPQELASTAWALATVDVEDTRLLGAIARATRVQCATFGPQELANTAWAFGKLRVSTPFVFEAVERAAIAKLGAFKPMELVGLIWGFSKAEVPAWPLYEAVAKAAIPNLRTEFTARELATLVWAFSDADVTSPHLFRRVAETLAPRVHALSPQGLATTARAYARAASSPAVAVAAAAAAAAASSQRRRQKHRRCEAHVETLFDAIARVAIPKLGDFNTQELSNLALAFATVGMAPAPKKRLLDALEPTIIARIDDCGAEDLADVAFAYYKAGHDAPGLHAAISHAANTMIPEFTPDLHYQLRKANVHLTSRLLYDGV